jgi:hypothetical protein
VLSLVPASVCRLDVDFSYDGSYAILVDQEPWLMSGDTFFRADGTKYSARDKSLLLQGTPQAVFGEDSLGQWKGFKTNYTANGKLIVTDVRWYTAADQPVAIFTQVPSN